MYSLEKSSETQLHLAKADRLNNLLSDRFYSSEQGYLLQCQLKFQNRSLGLYLILLEGVNDALLQWPFDKPFTLSLVDQQQGPEDALVSIDPLDPTVSQEACPESFWRPFGRNDACESANALSFDQLYDRKFIRIGAILLKAVIFLEEIRPPRFASLTIEENYLSARFAGENPESEGGPTRLSRQRKVLPFQQRLSYDAPSLPGEGEGFCWPLCCFD
ncbi:uncharacterized protein TNIN_434071 [Trichonephila inaurata madagascariensis]|uniref:TRAF1-6 MATH domain-containing protein n=1 Tax=Trichonephila inaurata madagascariensis TaxID=2747483 RepID=A0A8X6XLU9_9ARAC|nr:uncharacterized protein TNIN_434071 [Trichonephila inaurata madagascariensis]